MFRSVAVPGALLGFVLASVVAAGQAAALEPSGTAIRVDPAVNATGAGGERLLELEGAVFMGDEIVASPNGLAQIKFIDDTRLVVGPNSRLMIDTFVFNPNNTAKKVTINALRGTFRFISGKSPHEAYTIRTPTMTIGVRGTIVDIAVGITDSSAMFQEGVGDICSGGSCVQVEHTCQIWVVPRGGGITESTGVDRQRRLSVSFPFQSGRLALALAPEFRLNSQNCAFADTRSFQNPPEGGDTKGVEGGGPGPSTSPTTGEPPADDDEDDDYPDDDYPDDDDDDCGSDCA